MTLVTLPIGRLVLGSRPHTCWPVPASARSAPSARTPAGAAAAAGRALAGRALVGRTLAREAFADRALAGWAPAGTVPVGAALAGAAATTAARMAPTTGGTARRAGSRMARKVITWSLRAEAGARRSARQDVRVEDAGRVERGPEPGKEGAFGVRAHQRQPAGLER